MKKTLRSAMLSTICMLVVAVMSLTGVTYAWFSAAETATVGGMKVSVGAAGEGFMVSENGTDWSSNVDFTGDITKTDLMPVSTVNAKDFFTATVNSTSEGATSITAAADSAKANVVTLTFYAKNTSATPVSVYLANAGIFKDGDATDAKEAYQAARMAVFTKTKGATGDSTIAYIWGEGEENLGVQNHGTTENCYATGGIIAAVPSLKKNLNECKFDLPAMVDEAETIIEVTIVLWIEGQDAQCINPNASDSFDVELNLTINKPGTQG